MNEPSTNGLATIESTAARYDIRFHDARDHILRQILSTGDFYEGPMLRALLPLLKQDDFIIDAGANVGNHSLFFAGEAGCRVLAIEPVNLTHDLLVQNIGHNGLENFIFARRFGLGASNGLAVVEHFDNNNLGSARLDMSLDGEVVVRTLDSLPEVQTNEVALIKIDVEGMEIDVLAGSREIIVRDSPLIVCECQTTDEFIEVSGALSKYGYAPTECFNATPTYLFMHQSWRGDTDYSKLDFLADALFRSSVARQKFQHDISILRRQVNKLEAGQEL